MEGCEVGSARNWRVIDFFFNDTATTEIYTLSLHDALPIFIGARPALEGGVRQLGRSHIDRLIYPLYHPIDGPMPTGRSAGDHPNLLLTHVDTVSLFLRKKTRG